MSVYFKKYESKYGDVVVVGINNNHTSLSVTISEEEFLQMVKYVTECKKDKE